MTFFEIFVSVIASAGGLGAILWISIKSVSKYLVEDLNKKYQLQLDKQLEEYKKTLDIEKSVHNSMLSNKVYITKSKFDVELAVYRDLSRLFMVMTKSCSFPIYRRQLLLRRETFSGILGKKEFGCYPRC